VAITSYFRRAIKDIGNNAFVSSVTIVTISFLVLMVASLILFLENAGRIMEDWRKGVPIMAYLKSDIPDEAIDQLLNKIKDVEGVKEVRFISSRQALDILKEHLDHQGSILDNLEDNPLPDAIEIITGGGSADTSLNFQQVEALAAEIKSISAVDQIEYGQQWLERFSSIFDLFRLIGFVIGGIFVVAAVFIIANTIRLVIYTRRDELQIMRLVGAYESFIKIPFYLQGIIQAGVGALIGITILLAGYTYLVSSIQKGFLMIDVYFLSLKTCMTIIVATMLLGMLGCFVSLIQFLKD
jgi:cell division transport system permease protein